MKKSFLVISICLISFLSCKKKDSEPKTVTPSVATLSGSYKITKVAVISGSTESDVTNFYLDAPCKRDDIYKLNANLSYELIDAGVQCSPSNSTSGTWSFANNAITIDGVTGTIRKFDGTNLEVTGSFMGLSGVIYYVKQ